MVDKADAIKESFSEDKGIFDTIKDAIRTVKKGADLLAGGFNDLTAVVAQLKSVVNTIDDLLDAVVNIYDAAINFTEGLTDFIEAPFASVSAAIVSADTARAAINAFNEKESQATSVPDAVDQKLGKLQDGLEIIASYPVFFERPLDALIREKRGQQESRRSLSEERKAEALDFGSPATFDSYRTLGTQLTAGDVGAAEGEITTGSLIRQYQNAREVRIEEGDTLAGLAAQYMGDARLWQYIAIVNGLKPPYINEQASMPLVAGVGSGSTLTGSATGADGTPFSKTLGIGSKILIPTNQRSALDLPILPVMGVPATEPAENQFLGTDLELEAVGGNFGSSRELYDIPIDTEGGGIDAKRISGKDNLAQALVIRLLTTRGSDTLYKNLGVDRMVSLNFTELDLSIARFRIIDAISSDSRVSSIQKVQFQQGDGENVATADRLQVDLDVGIRGFSESRPIQVIL